MHQEWLKWCVTAAFRYENLHGDTHILIHALNHFGIVNRLDEL